MKTLLTLLVLVLLTLCVGNTQAIETEFCLLFMSDGSLHLYVDDEATSLPLSFDMVTFLMSEDVDFAYVFMPLPDDTEHPNNLALIRLEPNVAPALLLYAEFELAGASMNAEGDLLFATIDSSGDADLSFLRHGMDIISGTDINATYPTWGPQGSHTFAATLEDGTLALFQTGENYAGGVVEQTEVLGEGVGAQWSPNEETIAYITTSGEVAILDIATSDEYWLRLPVRFDATQLLWLDDGDLLIAGSYGDEPVAFYQSASTSGGGLELIWEEDEDMYDPQLIPCPRNEQEQGQI